MNKNIEQLANQILMAKKISSPPTNAEVIAESRTSFWRKRRDKFSFSKKFPLITRHFFKSNYTRPRGDDNEN